MKVAKISKCDKYSINPFIEDTFIIEKGRQTVIAGSTKKVMVDMDTGESEGIALLHKYKEVDKAQFIKIFLGEIASLFDLTKSGLKVFGYVLTCMKINNDKVYINITKLMEYCNYKSKPQVYRGLAELVASKIIAMSDEPNLWYINPNVVFNGDRIAFVKEYRLKKANPKGVPEGTTLKD